jgi:hypothetical protein
LSARAARAARPHHPSLILASPSPLPFTRPTSPQHTHSLPRLVAFHTGTHPAPKLATALADLAPALAKTSTFIATVGTGSGGGARTAARFFGSAAAVEETAAKHGVARYVLLADRKAHVLPAVGTAREDEAPALRTLLGSFAADPDAAGAPAVEVPPPSAGAGGGGVNGGVAAAASAAYAALPPSLQARLDGVGAALAAKGVDPAKAGAAGAGLAAVVVVGALAGGRGGSAQARGGGRRRKRE